MNIPVVYHAPYFKTLVICVAISCLISLGFSAYFLITVGAESSYSKTRQVKISFLNVGQGDGTLIQTNSGATLLIDTGPPSGPFFESISKALNPFDRHIDILFATHADADHIGGFPKLLEKFSYGIFIDNFVQSGTTLHQRLNSIIESETIAPKDHRANKLRAYNGMKIKISNDDNENDEVVLEILFPDFEYIANKIHDCLERKKTRRNINCKRFYEFDTNEMSIVTRLMYGTSSVMLTGDAPKSVERFIMEQAKETKQEGPMPYTLILKAGHHGSKTSTDSEFVKWLHPKYAIVSAGKDNRYGHPNKEVVDTLQKHKVEILRTDEKGTITFMLD